MQGSLPEPFVMPADRIQAADFSAKTYLRPSDFHSIRQNCSKRPRLHRHRVDPDLGLQFVGMI
jgi:hypothetical protein